MAKRTIHVLIDDIDGGDADETIRFAVDGSEYEIDLSKKNALHLRKTLARYQEAGTKLGRFIPSQSRGVRLSPGVAEKERNRAIREWADGQQLEISDRGRITQAVVDAYDARLGPGAPDALAAAFAALGQTPPKKPAAKKSAPAGAKTSAARTATEKISAGI
jgi:hypothetical protein